MKKKRFFTLAASLLLLFTATWTSDIFVFKYRSGQSQQYDMDAKVYMNMDMNVNGQSLKMAISTGLRYKIMLVPVGQPGPGIQSLKIAPSGVEGDWDINGPTGHIVLKLRGNEMTGTQNGNVTIDTAKGIGTEQAKRFKNEIIALFLTGFMDIDRFGRMKQFRGEQSFVDFWKQSLETQIGFFGIVFPDRPLPIGTRWEETLVMKKLGQVTLEGEGIRCGVSFTRQADQVSQGKKIAVFSLSSPLSWKNQAGLMEQAGQKIRLNIPSLTRSSAGTLRFDAEKGVMIDALTKADVDAAMNAMYQGQSMTVNLQVRVNSRLTLVTGQ